MAVPNLGICTRAEDTPEAIDEMTCTYTNGLPDKWRKKETQQRSWFALAVSLVGGSCFSVSLEISILTKV